MAVSAEAIPVAVDPADELFMYAMELADTLGREGVKSTCFINLDELVIVEGWRGRLLRMTTTRRWWITGWIVGTYNRGGEGNKWLTLGANGRLYLAELDQIYGGRDGRVPIFDDVTEVDHYHFGAGAFAENMLRRLEQFATQMRGC